jgi:hypothetical protein
MVLRPLDYAVILGYLVALTLFGSWFAKFQKTTRDYFLADRSAPWWANLCFTIVATETSTLSFIGVPASRYTGNMTFLQLAIGYIIGRLLVSANLPAARTSAAILSRRTTAPATLRDAGEDACVRHLSGDAVARRRHPLFATALVIAVVTGVPVSWTVILLGAR